MPQWIAIASLVLSSFIWGAHFILVKWTVATLDVQYYLAVRFLVAFLTLALIFPQRVLMIRSKATWRAGALLSVLMFAGYLTQSQGQRFTTASNTGLITSLYIILIPLASWLLWRRRVPLQIWVGAMLCLVGLVLLTQYSFSGFTLGDFLVLLCAISFGAHIMLLERLAQRHDPIQLVAIQALAVAVFAGAIVAVQGTWVPLAQVSRLGWATIGSGGILCTAFAFVVQIYAQRVIDATRAGIIFALEGCFGVLVAAWVGDERLTRISLIGAGLMVIGAVVAEWPRRKRVRTNSAVPQ